MSANGPQCEVHAQAGRSAIKSEQGPGCERIAEIAFTTEKVYADPFNEVDVEVIFERDHMEWRVPAFWRGGQAWAVRFAPPAAGDYAYRLECSDRSNPDLNGDKGRVSIRDYAGCNALLRRGNLKVSANKRYFEHADGTPFFWLADIWWTGLSDRLSWDGFQRLVTDREAKSFSVVLISAGLIPTNEEKAPSDAGFCNEGGCAWEADFERINPLYFDYADRRIDFLVERGIVPAICGAWYEMATTMGEKKLKQHWRYIIARYAAYPVFWILGGEIYELRSDADYDALPDNPPLKDVMKLKSMSAWAEVARYVRAIDPNCHPLAVHEPSPPFHGGLADPRLTDFDLLQPAHWGWSSMASLVAQVSSSYARTDARPVVQGEVGFERLGGEHFEDFQRAAFWLSMLNGAAGHSYGNIEIAEAYSLDKPLHRRRWSFSTWEEAMALPGAVQVARAAKFLRRFNWHLFEPHPDWVIPRGTTLFEPNTDPHAIDIQLVEAHVAALAHSARPLEDAVPDGTWKNIGGTFRRSYAAGIAAKARMIYNPSFGIASGPPPTILGLEPGVRYRASYFEPALGIEIDLGDVERPLPAPIIREGPVESRTSEASALGPVALVETPALEDCVAFARFAADTDLALLLRYQGPGDFVAAIYSASERAFWIETWSSGKKGPRIGRSEVSLVREEAQLEVELRASQAMIALECGEARVSSPIVTLSNSAKPGRIAIQSVGGQARLEVRESPNLPEDRWPLDRRLIDGDGQSRGEMSGTSEWEDFGRSKTLLLDAYQPPVPPFAQDWLIVLDADKSEPWHSRQDTRQ